MKLKHGLCAVMRAFCCLLVWPSLLIKHIALSVPLIGLFLLAGLTLGLCHCCAHADSPLWESRTASSGRRCYRTWGRTQSFRTMSYRSGTRWDKAAIVNFFITTSNYSIPWQYWDISSLPAAKGLKVFLSHDGIYGHPGPLDNSNIKRYRAWRVQ